MYKFFKSQENLVKIHLYAHQVDHVIMKNFKNPNLILIATLLMHALWLVLSWFIENDAPYPNRNPQLLMVTMTFGILLITLPQVKWSPLVQVTRQLERNHWLALTLLALLILIVDVVYFLYLRWGHDEPTFLLAVQSLTKRGVGYFFANYGQIPWLGGQHPPLPVLGTGSALYLLDSNMLITARGVAALIGFATAACTYLIARQLYDRQTALLAALLLFAVRHFYMFNIVAGNDLYITFFFTLTVLLFLQMNRTVQSLPSNTPHSMGWAIAAGLSLGLGMLSKYTMVLAYLLLPATIWWPFAHQSRFKDIFTKRSLWLGTKQLIIVIGISSLLVGSWLWYLYQSELIQEQAATVLSYGGIEVEPSSETLAVAEYTFFDGWHVRFLIRALTYKIPSAIGVYNLPLILLGLWVWITQRRNRHYMWANGFLFLWLIVVFIPVLVTLPVERYVMPAYPALAVMMAHGLRTMSKEPTRIVLLVVALSLTSLWLFTQPIQDHRCMPDETLPNASVTDPTPYIDFLCPGLSGFP